MKTEFPLTIKIASSFSYLNANTYCVDLSGNILLRIGSLRSPDGRIYFTNSTNPPNNIPIPNGIVVTNVSRNVQQAPVFLRLFGDFIIHYPTSYEVTFNNQLVVSLINQEQSAVEIANNLNHFMD